MTLLEAFLLLQPFGDDRQLNERVNEAAAVVATEAMRISRRRLRFPDPSLSEDAAQNVLVRLLSTGPRCELSGKPLAGAPTTDAAVIAFLLVSLRNASIDLLPRIGEELVDPASLVVQSETEPDYQSAEVAYARAERHVRTHCTTTLTPALRQAVEELVVIDSGAETVETLVDAEVGLEAQTSDRKKARDRRYTRYKRALEALHALIDEDTTLDADSRRLHHRVVDDLRIRQGSAGPRE